LLKIDRYASSFFLFNILRAILRSHLTRCGFMARRIYRGGHVRVFDPLLVYYVITCTVGGFWAGCSHIITVSNYLIFYSEHVGFFHRLYPLFSFSSFLFFLIRAWFFFF
jgi:hypothetical protein